jgi:hypothetical protein
MAVKESGTPNPTCTPHFLLRAKKGGVLGGTSKNLHRLSRMNDLVAHAAILGVCFGTRAPLISYMLHIDERHEMKKMRRGRSEGEDARAPMALVLLRRDRSKLDSKCVVTVGRVSTARLLGMCGNHG